VAGSCAADQLGRELARELRRRWRHGERVFAEAWLNRHAELWQQPELAVELIYEEFCQRLAGGEDGGLVERELLARFPQWAAPLGVMLDCHRVLQPDRDESQFPAVGDSVGEFVLQAELRRGSRGRVFLATQPGLADRPVVLKVTPLDGAEHLSLARLQHTNIVPLYSVLDDAARNIRVLCMPYFGRATLASVLNWLGPKGQNGQKDDATSQSPDAGVPLTARAGQHVVDAIDRLQEPSAPTGAGDGAARQMLAHVPYVQAMCWITACLADALEFAHARGVVHLDLKPSNVLLASDGQPMLLDFHLAREPILPGGPLPENFGGTPGYMPPEQLAAMQALQNGRPVEVTVDGRADIFALGAMLYESLGGRLPSASEPTPLSELNPQVSTGLSDIVVKCLAPRAENRYAHAAELADDLRRHWTYQPLVGVANRSVAERWHKFRRRRPNTLRAAGMFGVVAAAAAILIAGTWSQFRDRQQQAEHALRDGLVQLEAGHNYREAVRTFERGLAAVETLPFQRDLRQQLRDQLTATKRLQLAEQLHNLADETRFLYVADSIPADRVQSLAAHCDAFWDKRAEIVEQVSDLPGHDEAGWKPAPRSDWAADLLDISIFAAMLRVKSQGDPDPAARRRKALQLLDEAEALFGPSAVLEHERRSYRNTLGSVALAAQTTGSAELNAVARGRDDAMAARRAWEHCALGRSFLAAGDLARAGEELARARALDPAGRWANFYFGLCAYRQQRYEEAIEAFSVCIGASPKFAGCYFNRALAYTALGRRDDAMRDYDRTLSLDPSQAAAALNRGMLHLEHKHFDAAIADLRHALECGADPSTVHYDLALVHVAANDAAAARANLDRALEHNAHHEQARTLRDALRSKLTRPASNP
jgi:serine/threonine protein kinase/lipopolysaccharide biosynthesis regulator YciM